MGKKNVIDGIDAAKPFQKQDCTQCAGSSNSQIPYHACFCDKNSQRHLLDLTFGGQLRFLEAGVTQNKGIPAGFVKTFMLMGLCLWAYAYE